MTLAAPSTTDRVGAFHEHRPLLFSIAYRMLGSAAGAEDVVQDAYLRWQHADAADIRSPKSYLSTTVTRLALDQLRSARARRETYVGPWLPEPLVGVDAHDPLAAAALVESLSMAFLIVLERLSPTQRAAFLLREAFGFEYSEIARVLATSEANTRQLVNRAKQRVSAGRPRFACEAKRAEELTRRFLAACETGEVEHVLALLAHDAVAWSDGGGKFAAARRPVIGADRVARFLSSVVRKWRARGELSLAPVNGGIGLLLWVAGRLQVVMTVAVDDGDRVKSVFIVVNPDKLMVERPSVGMPRPDPG